VGIKKAVNAGSVLSDHSVDYVPYIIANPHGHLKVLHPDAKGYITLQRKNPAEGEKREWNYSRAKIPEVISDWATEDGFISMNTFFTPKRLKSNLQEIRTHFVDIDCQTKNKSAEATLATLKKDYFGKQIPTPNLVIFSGRGLNLIWRIEPLKGYQVGQWDELQKEILKPLRSLGADNGARDAARVFRIPGSINTKNGAQVYAMVLHEYIYTHEEIGSYFPKAQPKANPKKPKKAPERPADGSEKRSAVKGRLTHFHTPYSLSVARMHDIETLIRLRKGDMEGCREYSLFLYRLWCLEATNGDRDRAIAKIREINKRFKKPLTDREVVGDTKSAEGYYDAEDPFLITHKTVIEWLGITKEEQRHLKTIITKAEKQRRDTEKKRQQRRAMGMREMDEYIQERQSQKEQRIEELRRLLVENPKMKQKEIADLMGVDRKTVSRWKKEL